jgi:hypothetical protein
MAGKGKAKPERKRVSTVSEVGTTVFGCLRDQGRIEGDIVGSVLAADAWETVTEWDELVGTVGGLG